MPRTFPDPFVPQTFSCWITKSRSVLSAVDRSTGERSKRPVDRWDLKGRVDGIQWVKRFSRAGPGPDLEGPGRA
jgi:hypothetical protein